MIKVSYPGKLFLMGEYAAMETAHKSIIASVDRFLHVTLESSSEWDIQSSFGHVRGKSVFAMQSMPEVSATLVVLETYLERPLKAARLCIVSELDEGDKKYGFGSSGVIIVAVLSAVLEHEAVTLSKLEMFKLAVLVQRHLGSYSSGGDLASTIYQNVIIYTRYDVNWLDKQSLDLKSLISIDWPELSIESLDLEPVADILIGWTQTSNRTEHFTKAVKKQADIDPMTYRAFLLSSQVFVSDFIGAVKQRNQDAIARSVAMYRGLMRELGLWAKIAIETESLTHLIEDALQCGFPAKISGSGGGDCGFALIFKNDKSIEPLLELWHHHHIQVVRRDI